jgi:glycosyltransferase involved in cell wall biosynthesis
MRVLQFCDYYGPSNGGGSERVAREVNRRLAARGARVTVVSAQSGAPYDDDGVTVLRRPAVDLTGVVGAQLALSPGYMRWAASQADKLAPDVIYAHSIHFHGSLVAARLSRRTRVPLVGVVHVGALDSLGLPARVLAETHEQTLGRFVLRSCVEVIAVAPSVATHATRRGARAPVVVASNGVDHARFTPGPRPCGPPNVVFVGRLVENKGPKVLLEAARLLWRDGHRFRLIFVGDGPQRIPLAREAARAAEPARFVGYSDDVPGWLRAATVVVRPSFTEGMPLAVLEAMAAARCIVASDIAAHRDLLHDGREALLHRVGDHRDLFAKLRRVLTDEALRTRLATCAHARASRYTWARCTDAHMEALVRAVRRNDRRRRP